MSLFQIFAHSLLPQMCKSWSKSSTSSYSSYSSSHWNISEVLRPPGLWQVIACHRMSTQSNVHYDVNCSWPATAASRVVSCRPPAVPVWPTAANAVAPGRRAVHARRPPPAACLLFSGDRVERLLCLSFRRAGPVCREDVQLRCPLCGVSGRLSGSMSVSGDLQQLRWLCRQLACLLNGRRRLRQRLRDAQVFLPTYDRHRKEIWRKVRWVPAFSLL